MDKLQGSDKLMSVKEVSPFVKGLYAYVTYHTPQRISHGQ